MVADQLALLVSLLTNEQRTFKAIGDEFDTKLGPMSYASAVNVLRALMEEGSIFLSEFTEAMIAVYLLHHLSQKEPKNGRYRGTSQVFHTVLQRLEVLMSADARVKEQNRYRATSVAKKDKRIDPKDVATMECMRCRGVLKIFMFQCLLNELDANTTPKAWLSMPDDKVETELGAFSSRESLVRMALNNLTASHREEEAISLRGVESSAVMLPQVGTTGLSLSTPLVNLSDHPSVQEPPYATPQPARPVPPSGVTASSFVALSSTQGITGELVYDSAVNPADAVTVKALLAEGRTQELSSTQQQQLSSMLSPLVVKCCGLSPSTFSSICRHNASLAATILKKITDAKARDAFITALLQDSTLPLSCVDVVVLGVGFAQPTTLSLYIRTYASRMQGKPGSESVPMAQGLATTLHQIVQKGGATLTGQDETLLRSAFAAHHGVSDVASLWPQYVK